MALTLTIKQVPKSLADGLRRRAATNHRSQQRELLLILERAVAEDFSSGPRVAEPSPSGYAVKAPTVKGGKGNRTAATGRLNLEQLWQRARKVGGAMPGESAAIVRRDRDARHGG